MEFKVGDKVKIKSKSTGQKIEPQEVNQIDEISEIRGSGLGTSTEDCIIIHGNYFCAKDLELINNNNQSTMTLKDKFLLALKSEPEKSFRRLGITNGDDMLTTEGTELFLNFLFEKNKTEFKKDVVDSIIAEEEKSKK